MKGRPFRLGLLVMLLAVAACSAVALPASQTPPASLLPPASETPVAAGGQKAPTSTPVPPTLTPGPRLPTPTSSPEAATATLPAEDVPDAALADVISVEASGEAGAYRFAVGIRSPDTGCDRYANWWEVVDEDGELIYRRVLLHSHVDEQPFVRSGGPIDAGADTVLWVRAHMNRGGYGGAAFRGSVEEGFRPADLDPGFASGLADEPPLPDGCAF